MSIDFTLPPDVQEVRERIRGFLDDQEFALPRGWQYLGGLDQRAHELPPRTPRRVISKPGLILPVANSLTCRSKASSMRLGTQPQA